MKCNNRLKVVTLYIFKGLFSQFYFFINIIFRLLYFCLGVNGIPYWKKFFIWTFAYIPAYVSINVLTAF